jgi:hypothetical protein
MVAVRLGVSLGAGIVPVGLGISVGASIVASGDGDANPETHAERSIRCRNITARRQVLDM